MNMLCDVTYVRVSDFAGKKLLRAFNGAHVMVDFYAAEPSENFMLVISARWPTAVYVVNK